MKIQILHEEKGSAYIFVLIIFFTAFTMLLISLNITSYQVKVIDSINNSSNLYHFAESGAIQGVNILNSAIEENHHEIEKLILDELKKKDISSISYYENGLINNYDGEFHFKLQDSGSVLGERDVLFKEFYLGLADEYVINYLQKKVEAGELFIKDNFYYFKYTIFVDDKNEYEIKVEININKEKSPNKYNIYCQAKNIITGLSTKVEAVATSAYKPGTEIFIENINATPEFLNYNLISEKEIVSSDSKLQGSNAAIITDLIDSTIRFENSPSNQKNSLYVLGLTQDSINIGDFCEENTSSAAIIIANNGLNLNITSPGADMPLFNGIIFCEKDINILGAHFNMMGSIISKGNINIEDSEINFSTSPDIFRQLNFDTISLKRRLFDFFNITKFKEHSNEIIYNIQTISPDYEYSFPTEVIINDLDVAIKIETLMEVEN